ncbi:hypothetical protein F5Y02DRAFT_414854 [Annulohypoxylon stygium]|nr:hypothetical protein F5Y02DRAFT_414854 [Annulohypoxylon stygium]
MSDRGYSYKGSGTNSQGNHYCARDYGSSGSNSNTYHYSNNDGSYYYFNPNATQMHSVSYSEQSVSTPGGTVANSVQYREQTASMPATAQSQTQYLSMPGIQHATKPTTQEFYAGGAWLRDKEPEKDS